jgi:hypothetical protein
MTNPTPQPPEPDQPGQPDQGAAGPNSARAYPVARGNRIDRRFTDGLLCDVADVLADHGYPVIEVGGGDYEELGWTLWRFIFGRPAR